MLFRSGHQKVLDAFPLPLGMSAGKSGERRFQAMLFQQPRPVDFMQVARPLNFFGMQNLAKVVDGRSQENPLTIERQIRKTVG